MTKQSYKNMIFNFFLTDKKREDRTISSGKERSENLCMIHSVHSPCGLFPLKKTKVFLRPIWQWLPDSKRPRKQSIALPVGWLAMWTLSTQENQLLLYAFIHICVWSLSICFNKLKMITWFWVFLSVLFIQ